MTQTIKLAWRNMWRNGRRTTIAATAIILGLILLILVDSMIKGSDQAIFGNAVRLYGGNIQVHAQGYRERASRLPLLPIADADAVVTAALAQPHVRSAVKRIHTGGLVSAGDGTYPVRITAIQPGAEAPTSLIAENISQGRFLDDADGDAILIGQGLADQLKVRVGDYVTLLGRRVDGSLRQSKLVVVGVYNLGLAEAEKGTVFINLPMAQTLYNLRDQETEVAIILDDVVHEEAVIAALSAKLPGYEVDSWKTLRPEIINLLQTKQAVITIFGLVVMLIASIGILNLMLVAVFERTREMGVLAALGLKGRQVMLLFLLEGAFIGAFGAVVGCLLGWVVVAILGTIGLDFSSMSGMGEITALMGTRIYPTVAAADVLGYGLSVVVIAALAALIPAWQAAKQEPAQALRHV